ncbi:unnamed protein product [Camellia sinensis]
MPGMKVDEFDGDEPIVNDIGGNEEQTNIPAIDHHMDIPDVDHSTDMSGSSEEFTTSFPGGPVDPSILTNFSCHVATKIWNNEERDLLRCLNHGTFVERWQPETNSFHMPFGDMSMSLDDISTILRIHVTGTSVSTNKLSRDEAAKVLVKSLGVLEDDAVVELKGVQGELVRLEWSHEKFQSVSDADSDDFIHYLQLLKDLNLVHSYAWGAAALAFLYRQLGMATKSTVRQIAGYMTVVKTQKKKNQNLNDGYLFSKIDGLAEFW